MLKESKKFETFLTFTNAKSGKEKENEKIYNLGIIDNSKIFTFAI